ncbi:NBS-containing resistance-like protein [Tanacetum coccineum]
MLLSVLLLLSIMIMSVCVYLYTNLVQHQRTKHIKIDIHFVRDYVASGQVRVLHIPSLFQYADIFTKGLPSALFCDFRSSLNYSLDPTVDTPPTSPSDENGNAFADDIPTTEQAQEQETKNDDDKEKGFRDFVNMLQPQFEIPSRETITKDCMDLYVSEFESFEEDQAKNFSCYKFVVFKT